MTNLYDIFSAWYVLLLTSDPEVILLLTSKGKELLSNSIEINF